MKSLHLNKDWLYQKYIVEKLSTYDIAKIVNRNAKNVYAKLKDFNIPTRPRGLNLKNEDHWTKLQLPNPFKGKKHTSFTKRLLSLKASRPRPYLRGKNNGMHGRRGSLHHNWQGGKTPLRQKWNSRYELIEAKRKILARYSEQCVLCKRRILARKEIHHILPINLFPEYICEEWNLIPLCCKCHKTIEKKMKEVMKNDRAGVDQ